MNFSLTKRLDNLGGETALKRGLFGEIIDKYKINLNLGADSVETGIV